jgi:hypothetical protein
MSRPLKRQAAPFSISPKFRGDGADKAWIESEPEENRPNFTNVERGFIELEINEIVIAIDPVPEAPNRFKVMVQFQDFVQVT